MVEKNFHWILEIVQNNAYVLYALKQTDASKCTLLNFKLDLTYDLMKLTALTTPLIRDLPQKEQLLDAHLPVTV